MSENTLCAYEEIIASKKYGLCTDCKQPKTHWYWCQSCNSKRLQKDFNKWTSGNKFIDKFIQDSQLKARNNYEALEWYPYNHFRNIKYLAKGGFSIVYKAILLTGYIKKWDSKTQQWERLYPNESINYKDYEEANKENIKSPLNKNEKFGRHVVLKLLNNTSNINENFLNEWKNYLRYTQSASDIYSYSMKFYGITQDPESLNYMIVMEYMKLGDLRDNLVIKKYNPFDKYINLYFVAESLLALHRCNLAHGDLHSGNILLFNNNFACISDFGLSQPADRPAKSKEIYGIIPYIAPEVLRGNQYNMASDIYSFGIIMWEMISSVPAFNNVPHDFRLSLDICQGLRPKIVEGTEVEYEELMKRCWDSDPNKRPTAKELVKYFDKWRNEFSFHNEERILVPDNEPIIKNHPLSCYISRKIDFSSDLKEILDQDELSSKIIINNNNNKDDIRTVISESLVCPSH
ncbi:kinase-like domain-containing protein [Rhizophagus clarus]|uniref:Kinase-like domain-containing protein n=1 Tax=Rhizophagus clarus TaxID=94130 RepID=A0A8H3L833_9GLOM|nr:kinase-like domain-containing protein [Rhizophagus clarus]